MLSVKLFVLLGAIVIVSAGPRGLVGGPQELTGDELKEAEGTLQNSLDKLAEGDGPSYKVSQVNSATRQVVSGTLYKFDVDLIDSNDAVINCKVAIWSQPWLDNGTQVTVECEGQDKVVKNH